MNIVFFGLIISVFFHNRMSDSEPGEIKSPDLRALNRQKRAHDDRRALKADKKIKYAIESFNFKSEFTSLKMSNARFLISVVSTHHSTLV